jgi:hypothetical protein
LISPIATAVFDHSIELPVVASARESSTQPKQIWIGFDFLPFWFTDALFIDLIETSIGKSNTPSYRRLVFIDIDDVFQPNWSEDSSQRNVKIQRDDLNAILKLQKKWSSNIFKENFKFNLGFNSDWFAKEFSSAPFNDIDGDRAIVEHASSFYWFDHLPGHEQATTKTKKQLIALMETSKEWAKLHNVLPYVVKYAVSPAHLGINPPYKPLFEAWQKVWDIKSVATTETKSSFFFENIQVLPRLSCGVSCYSDNYLFSQVGDQAVDESILSIMDALIVHKVSFFMTHQNGYSRDRLASYAFDKAFTEIREATNIEFHTSNPEKVLN